MFQYIENINAYVEEDKKYKADRVKVELIEDTKTVKAYPCDMNGKQVSGMECLANESFSTFSEALKYYEHLCHELYQGDVIRNV